MKTLVCCIIAVAAFSLLAPGTLNAHDDHGANGKSIFTKHFQETLFEITEHGTYSIEILPDEKEYKIGKDVIGIVVHDAHDEDVTGADITIVHKNLDTSEKAPGTLKITEKGEGLYLVSNLNLQRDGRWELTVTVKKKGAEDRVKFFFPDALKAKVAKGRYSP